MRTLNKIYVKAALYQLCSRNASQNWKVENKRNADFKRQILEYSSLYRRQSNNR